ncbi:MAG: hypothetical protein JW913_03980 [Chitinispirillaceae bacterium]|nr:hypothetical protein [Chitinispirillaceae bacterium]
MFIGSPKKKKSINSFCLTLHGIKLLNLSGELTTCQLLALMQRDEIFVGNDSGPMHNAAVASLNGVVQFGLGYSKKW